MNAQTVLETSTVIEGLSKSAKSVRIPALAVTNNGTVIATMDARVDGSYDLGGGTNNIQIAMTRSTDNGATFSTPKIIAKAPTTSEGYGDPTPRRPHHRQDLLLLHLLPQTRRRLQRLQRRHVRNLHHQHPHPLHHLNRQRRHLERPDRPEPASPQIHLGRHVRLLRPRNQLNSGRLVQPIVYHDASGDHASNIYSDDHGATWHNGTTAGTGVNESKVVQRSTGRVAQNMRSNSGANRWYATAPDVTSPWNVLEQRPNRPRLQRRRNLLPTPHPRHPTPDEHRPTQQQRRNVPHRPDHPRKPRRRRKLAPRGPHQTRHSQLLHNGRPSRRLNRHPHEIANTGGIVFTRTTLPWLES